MIGPLSRIFLRYASAALVTWGVLSPSVGSTMATDPDLLAVIGFVMGFTAEMYYWAAKRWDWET